MKCMGRSIGIIAALAISVFCYIHAGVTVLLLLLGWFLGTKYDQAVHNSTKDELTNCYNRRYTKNKVDKWLRHARKNNKRLSLAVIDLNGFKQVNDTMGHHKGDSVLKQFSRILFDCCGKHYLIARWGGDEFIIVEPPHIKRNNMSEIIGNVEREMRIKFQTGISFTSGSATFPEDGDTFAELLISADQSMYQNKQR